MLFPPPPPSFRYFKPKNSQGVLAKFCSECGCHLDAHAYQWLTGGHGTVRACPPENQIATSSSANQSAIVPPSSSQQRNHQQQNQSMNSSSIPPHQQDLSSRPRQPYGSHHVYRHEADVDLSLTSSGLVGDKKTVGNVPAHHRFFTNRVKEAQREEAVSQHLMDQQHQQASSGNYDPRENMPPAPHAHPGQQQNQNQQQQVYYDEQTGEYYYYDEQEQDQEAQGGENYPPPHLQQGGGNDDYNNSVNKGYNSRQPGGRNFQLYDEAYSTPIPFGTESDLHNPPQVAGIKGRRHLQPQDHTGPMSNEEEYFRAQNEKGFPKMSANRARMEKSNLNGAGGVCTAQDAVRPDKEVSRSHIVRHRKDAQSHLSGAGGGWAY